MKTIYIKPCCEIIRVYTDGGMLAGSSDKNITVDTSPDVNEDITGPEYGDGEVPDESKPNPGYNIWDDEEDF